MSFDDIKDRIIITGFTTPVDEEKIMAAIRAIYGNSQSPQESTFGQKMIDEWLSRPVRTIEIIYTAGEMHSTLDSGRVYLDLAEVKKAVYIGNDGTAVQSTLEDALAWRHKIPIISRISLFY